MGAAGTVGTVRQKHRARSCEYQSLEHVVYMGNIPTRMYTYMLRIIMICTVTCIHFMHMCIHNNNFVFNEMYTLICTCVYIIIILYTV